MARQWNRGTRGLCFEEECMASVLNLWYQGALTGLNPTTHL